MSPACRLLSCWSLALIVLSGCGPGEGARAAVSGKVMYKGEPLPAGTVTFTSGSQVASSPIQNGEYSIPKAPVGDNKISVTTPAPPSAQQMKMNMGGKSYAGDTGKVVAVPGKYNNPELSGLTYQVKAGEPQKHDIELKD